MEIALNDNPKQKDSSLNFLKDTKTIRKQAKTSKSGFLPIDNIHHFW